MHTKPSRKFFRGIFAALVCLFASSVLVAAPRVTVIGDSISTFRNAAGPGYATHYPTSDVTTMNQTWWMQAITAIGGTLAANSAWTGSHVAGSGSVPDSAMASNYRLDKEKLGGDDVDVFMILAGTNDARDHFMNADNWPIGTFDAQTFDAAQADRTQFAPAFAYMINFLHVNYPSAQIWIVINCNVDDELGKAGSVTFTDATDWKPYADVMKSVALAYGAHVVELTGLDGTNKYSESLNVSASGTTKVHPTAAGMTAIANQVSAAYLVANPPGSQGELIDPSEVADLATSDDSSMRVFDAGNGSYAFVFTNASLATATLTVHKESYSPRALVVGGGGAGGGTTGGGGGGGGLLDLDWSKAAKNFVANDTLTISVGAGGAAVYDTGKGSRGGENGASSSLSIAGSTYTAPGGGGGGTYSNNPGSAGGCGGGSSKGTSVGATTMDSSDPFAHGFAGGVGVSVSGYYYGGGGGGAGESGNNTSSNYSGAGGDGYSCDITGSFVAYAGGGGGGACVKMKGGSAGAGGDGGGGAGASGASDAEAVGFPGTDGLGGGGGGGGGGVNGSVGGPGGCGCVIVLLRSVDHSITEIEVPQGLADMTVPYNGMSQKPAIEDTDDYTVSFSAGDWTAVGAYTVTLSLKDKESSVWKCTYTTDDLVYTLTIERKVVEIPTVPATWSIYNYDGSDHRPDLTTTEDIVVTATDGEWILPGKYLLRLELSSSVNRVWSDGTDAALEFVYFVGSGAGTIIEGSRQQTAWGEAYLLQQDNGKTSQVVRVTAAGTDVTWTVPANTAIEYLLVGGGGSGGYSPVATDNKANPGGGGAGAVIFDVLELDAKTELTLRVGAGGVSATSSANNAAGYAGEATTLAYGGEVRRSAPGGGGGAGGTGTSPAGESSVGSGGGGHANVGSQTNGGKHQDGVGISAGAIGHDGSSGGREFLAGGGGGAGGPGGATGGDYLCDGGDGLAFSITGTATIYAAGGAAEYGEGGSDNVGGRTPQGHGKLDEPIEAAPNTGSGGYGGSKGKQTSGAGADGVIVLRYAAEQADISLNVCGTPVEVGAVEPAYGIHHDITNFPIVCSSPATVQFDGHYYRNNGYRIGRVIDGVMTYGELVPSQLLSYGEASPGQQINVQWDWTCTGQLLAIEDQTTEYGVVTVTGTCIEGGYYSSDAELTLAVSGDDFLYWVGDVPSGQETDNPLVLTMDAPKTVRPIYRSEWVYDETAGTLSDGYWTFPATGEPTAITVGTPTAKGQTVRIDLDKGVKDGLIVGLSANWLRGASEEIRSFVSEVRLPDGVTALNGMEFRECAGLTKVVLSPRTESIGQGTFYGDTNLKMVEPMLPSTLTNLGANAFCRCAALAVSVRLLNRRLVLQDHSEYDMSTFYESGIEEIDLSQSRVDKTPLGFIRECANLKSVKYPKSLKHIGGGSHAIDSSLTDVWFQSFPTNFEDCVDCFYRTPDYGRIVYPKGDAGWERHIANEQAKGNFTAWGDAGARTNDYLNAFPDGMKPIGYYRAHKDSSYGNRVKWLVPHRFGMGMLIIVK